MSSVYVFNHYGGPDAQELIDRPIPVPGPGEMTIEVRAAGVNPVDWQLRAGHVGQARHLPVPMGHEVSGVVIVLDDDVDGFTVGDAVLGPVAPGHGGFAEHTAVRAAAIESKPEKISFTDAATLPVAGATAYDGIHQIELEAGQTILIIGIGGGVGLMAAQIGNFHGLSVIGTASDSKREAVESTGATLVPYGQGLPERIAAITPGGVDLILDLVGGQALRELAALATDRARVISVADPDTAVALGGHALERTADALAGITDVVERGLVDPHVTATYPLDRAGEAIAAVETGHATGKIVVEMS
jgi:NADPH:quinone reductase-like Zn-dependent oxidoreductase